MSGVCVFSFMDQEIFVPNVIQIEPLRKVCKEKENCIEIGK